MINKLAEIESGAAKILEDANNQKIALAKEMEARSKSFDDETDAATAKKLEAIKDNYRKEMETDLADLKSNTEQMLSRMESHFQTEHDARTEEIVKQILK